MCEFYEEYTNSEDEPPRLRVAKSISSTAFRHNSDLHIRFNKDILSAHTRSLAHYLQHAPESALPSPPHSLIRLPSSGHSSTRFLVCTNAVSNPRAKKHLCTRDIPRYKTALMSSKSLQILLYQPALQRRGFILVKLYREGGGTVRVKI